VRGRRVCLVAIAVGAILGTLVTRSGTTFVVRANAAAPRTSCTLTIQLAGQTPVVSLTATGLVHRGAFEVDWVKPTGNQRQYTSSNGSGVLRTTVLNNGDGTYAASVSSLRNRRKAVQASCHTTVSPTSTLTAPPTGAPGPTATPTATANTPTPTSSSTPGSTGPTNSTPPTPRPTSPPKPVPTPNPPPRPGGWPGPGNTGVPAGTTLTPSGSITVTADGTVLNALDITGCVDIQANNVTIKDSRIHGGSCWTQVTIQNNDHNALIEDTEIDGTNAHASPDDGSAIAFGGYTALRLNIHGNIDGVACDSPRGDAYGCTIEDSWIHNLAQTSASHNQDILSNGDSAGITIRHNRLDNQITQTGTIDLFGDFSPIQNVTIDNNLLNGGGFTVYGGCLPEKPYGCQNISITNNRFMRAPQAGAFFAMGGRWGPITSFNGKTVGAGGDDPAYRAAHGLTWSGNVWYDTGAPISL
jgi:hypothetical protein